MTEINRRPISPKVPYHPFQCRTATSNNLTTHSLLRWLLAGCWVVLILLGSCAPDEEQILFEQQAFAPPSNFTKTNERGIVESQDPDDWRIAPMFYRIVTVNPIYPNPTNGSDLRLQIYVERTDGLYGLKIFRYNPLGQQRYNELYRSTQTPLPPGILNIVIPFQLMFPEYPNLDVRGLHRIIVFDNRDNIVTYGDVKLE